MLLAPCRRATGKELQPLPAGIGFGIGPPLGHPRATQGPPKRDARVIRGWILLSAFVCNKYAKKAGWGGAIAGISGEIGKPKTFDYQPLATKDAKERSGNGLEERLSEYRLEVESPYNRFRSQGPQVMSEPVSRILYGVAAADGHSSRPSIAERLKRPTRKLRRSAGV